MKSYIFQVFEASIGLFFLSTLILLATEANPITYVIWYLCSLLIGTYLAYNSATKEIEKEAARKINLARESEERTRQEVEKEAIRKVNLARENEERSRKDEQLWKQTLLEKNSGFKTLLSFISILEQTRDEQIPLFLKGNR